MNLKFKLFAFLLVFTLFSCKKEAEEKTLDEYKYTEKGIVLNCDKFDLKLLNEALFSFENDILEAYGKNGQTGAPNLTRAYSQFIRNAMYGRMNYADIVSPHTAKVFEVLKSKQELWDLNNANTKLNYNSSVMACIANNMIDRSLKTTLNALLETNSMSPKLFGPALQSNYGAAIRDKYLSAYVALEFYYGKLFDVDLSQVAEKPEPKVDFNKIPPQTPQNNPHAGHNH
ncbi:hypothetical protein [Jejuia pallidilutea]|uniref:Lipoprotein n=1 Tax=Jejuia pallidilutea TaxID=504487 RepID=A0A090W2N1_9FLAO|nr:hypothetical protein [Jejuia pallidilutea]GAL67471.1 hypothetical protein JCM19301_444 [Jejuia pallidilutea]GAL71270.1 hypothetical protein JCM19302_947 [Jejuia pallidilutea]GAL88749.1 hypothetical protein JCM19538_1184 [Jejuia pallidilutea]